MAMGPKRAARAASKKPRLSKSLNVFGAQLRAFAEKTEETLEDSFRAIVLELFTSIIGDTPVDEGRARGNWQTTIGSPASGVVGRLDDTGPVGSPQASGTGGAIMDVLAAPIKLGGTVWLVNNLPYIGRLEYEHWSGQAPHGMVRKNIARLNQIVKEVAAGTRKV